MASFDPSIISQIPDYAGNPLEARSKAFKLADLMTQQQSNKLLLESQKQDQQDQQKARDIFKKNADSIGTPEGNIKLAQAYAKEGMSKQAMQAMQFGSEQQVRDIQAQEQKLKLLQFSSDVIGPAAYEVKQTLQTKGLPMAQALYQARLAEILPQLPPGAQHQFPPQLPNDPQQAAALLDKAIGASQQARQMVQQQLATRKEENTERQEGEREKHDRAIEAAAYRRQEGEGQHVETVVGDDKKPRRVLFDSKGNVVKDLGEAPAGRGEHPTEAENKAAVNYTTMKNAEDVLESPKYKDMNMAFLSTVEEDDHGYLHAIGRFGRKVALTPEQQVVAQAARQFAEGAGHLKSGARINQSTMQLMVDLYLPLPGDSPDLKARKLAARRNDLVAGRVGAGRAAENIEKAQTSEESRLGYGGNDATGASGWKIEPVK